MAYNPPELKHELKDTLFCLGVTCQPPQAEAWGLRGVGMPNRNKQVKRETRVTKVRDGR